MTCQESEKSESTWCHKAGANTPCSKNALAPCQVFCTHPPTHPPTPKTENANNSTTACPFFVFHPPSPPKKNTSHPKRPTNGQPPGNDNDTRDLHTWHSSNGVPLDESTQNALRQGASWRVKNKDLQLMRQQKLQVQGAVDAERMFSWCNWSGCVPPWMEV